MAVAGAAAAAAVEGVTAADAGRLVKIQQVAVGCVSRKERTWNHRLKRRAAATRALGRDGLGDQARRITRALVKDVCPARWRWWCWAASAARAAEDDERAVDKCS